MPRPEEPPLSPRNRRLADLAGATPEKRDRYVDFLRALSVTVVVLGHWLGALIEVRQGRISGISSLDVVPGLWIATWALQIMPIFFFVGGFSNMVTFESMQRLGEGPGTFLRGRSGRLLRPVGFFLLFWALVGPLALRIPGLPDGALEVALPVLLGPLWFLCAYVVLVAVSPLMVRLHHRFPRGLILLLGVLPVIVDFLRFAVGVPGIGWANFLFVWLFIHQLGFFYADGTFARTPRRRVGWVAVAGYAAMIGLAQLDTYPSSMVGCCGDEISNMAPPTLPIMALGIGQVALAMLLRPAVTRWLSRPGPWKAVVAVNASIMTLFLWHLSALVLTAALLLPLGFPQPPMGSILWWLLRPVWFGVATAVLAVLVMVWGRFERPDLDPAERYWNLEEFYAL